MKNAIKIWKEKGKILEGIKNNLFKTEHVELIAEERLTICKKCDLFDHKGTACVVPGTGPCCGDCGCTLKLKIRSLSSECPNGFWLAELTFEEEYILNKKLQDENKID